MNFLRIIILLILINCINNILYASVDGLRLEAQQIKAGDVNGNTNTIFEDSRGFIWFGTEGGLCRFDGYSCVEYKHDEEDSLTLDNDYIIHINEDSVGNLWIGTRLGLNILDPLKEDVVRIPIYWVTDICKSSYGGFWIASRDGLFRTCESNEMEIWALKNKLPVRQYGNKKFIKYESSSDNSFALNDDSIKCLMEDSKGNLWIGTDHEGVDWGAVHMLKKNENNQYPPRFIKYKHIDESNRVQMCRWPEEFYEDEWGNIWIASWWDGLIRLNPDNGEISHVSYTKDTRVGNENLMALEPDNEGNLYLGSYGDGLFRINYKELNKKNPTVEHIPLGFKGEVGLENYVLSLYVDASNTIWMGSKGQGVIKTLHNFKYKWVKDYAFPDKTSKYVSYLSNDLNDKIYIGYNDGSFSVYDKSLKKWQHFSLELNTEIRHVSKYSDYEFLVGGEHGFFIVNEVENIKQRFFESFSVKDSIKNASVSNVIKLDKNKLAVVFTGYFGIGIVDGNNFSNILYDYNFIQGIYRASNGNYWLYRRWQDPILLDDEFNVLRYLETGSFGEGKSTYGIVEDKNGRIWLANEQGVSVIDTQTFESVLITDDDGLLNNKSSSILMDKNGFIWVGSQGGISRINPENFKIINFDSNDGLGAIHFIEKAGIITNDGEIYLGTDNGVISFSPEDVKVNKLLPPVYITKFNLHNKLVTTHTKVENRIILPKSISQTDTIILDYKSNVLSFEFAALNYIEPNENRFAYKMEGVDNDWVYVNADRRFASYAGLRHGDYRFIVKASNNDGYWNNTGDSLFIRIKPPWWFTPWFYSLVVLTVIGLVFLIFTIRLKSLRNSEARLMNLVAQRTTQLKESNNELKILNEKKDQFMRIMAHDLKNPIGNITAFLEFILSEFDREPIESTKKNLAVVNRQMEDTYQLLENLLIWESKTLSVNKKLNILSINVLDIVKANMKFFENNLKNIELINNCPKEAIVMADLDMLNFIIRNLLGNAMKFSFQDSSIQVNYKWMDGKNWIEIEDTGTGMDQKQIELFDSAKQLDSLIGTDGEKGTGLGLLNCRAFVLKMGGEMKILSDKDNGTSVFIYLPPEN